MSYNAIYRARAAASGGTLDVFVPQVFGDVPIKVTESVGGKVPGMGWVMFQGGDSAHPVWLPDVGLGSGGGGSATDDEVFVGADDPGTSKYELWYDTDATGSGGGVPTARRIDTTTPLSGGGDLSVDRTHTWLPTANVDMAGFKLTGLNTGASGSGDAVSVQYLDNRLRVAWTPLTPINGWVLPSVAEIQPGYRKIEDVVYLKGAVVGGATSALSQAVFNLPAGYYNTVLTRVSMVGFSPGGVSIAARADLGNTGAFILSSINNSVINNAALQLNGVSWPVGVT